MNYEHYIALGADFIDMDDSLEHYGVKGMKWGTRKRSNNQTTVASSGGGGGAVDPSKLALDNFYRTVGKDISKIQALGASKGQSRTARGAAFCESMIADQGKKSAKSLKEKLKGAYKAASNFISNLFGKKTTKKLNIASSAKSNLERINRSVGINVIKASKSRAGRSAGLTDSLRRRT